MSDRIPIEDVVIGERHRKDLGDLTSLMKSMETVGLLHPIVLDKDKNLIIGERRLEAARMLSWDDVPYRIADSFDEELKLMAERDENECRLDFKPSEATALGMKLEPRLREEAKERQKQHGGTAPGKKKNTSGTVPEVKNKRETREKVGNAVGMSGRTYQRTKTVVQAAADDPETFGQIAEEMDRTGKITAAYDKVQNIRRNKREVTEPEPTNGKADQPKRKGKGVIFANEAIDCLMRIPKDDPLRKRGFQIVTDWIKLNK